MLHKRPRIGGHARHCLVHLASAQQVIEQFVEPVAEVN
jgi:hypothetical protein